MRKRMFLVPIAFILFILFFTVFGERGLLSIHRLSREKQEIEKKADELRAENERLKREIEALRSDRRYLESIARRDFGLIRQNEIIYQFPSSEKSGTQPAAPEAPPKGNPGAKPAPKR